MSAVERGETAPSIGSLYRICEVLGVSMSTLFEAVASPDASVVRRAAIIGIRVTLMISSLRRMRGFRRRLF